MIDYVYVKENLLETPQKYQMTPFEGGSFLQKYSTYRKFIIKKLSVNSNFDENFFSKFDTSFKQNFSNSIPKNFYLEDLFLYIISNLDSSMEQKRVDFLITSFLKKFEIKKKFFNEYDDNFKETSENYTNLKNYLLFSEICSKKYFQTKKLQFLKKYLKIVIFLFENIFLKINDTICSQISKLKSEEQIIFRNLLENELDFIHHLCNQKGLKMT